MIVPTNFLQGIATSAVEAQNTADPVEMLDLLSGLESDLKQASKIVNDSLTDEDYAKLEADI